MEWDPLFDDETAVDLRPEPLPAPWVDEEVDLLPRSRTGRRAPARSRAVPRPAPVLPEAPSWLGWFARRFNAGEATLLFGPRAPVEHLLEMFYAGSAAAGSRISLIEGANRFPAYRIAERGRAFGVDPAEVLRRIRLARAFTVYQLVALVDRWAREVRRTRPTWLIAHELPALFFESECPEEEREPLLTHVAETLQHVADETRRPLLVTSVGGFGRFPGLQERGPRFFDLLRVTGSPFRLRVDAYRDGARLTLVHRSPGQTGLEAFGETGPEEVMAWDARYRPTGRRSRSG